VMEALVISISSNVPVKSVGSSFPWRSRFASRSSSPTTSTLEILTAPILPTPSTVVAPSSEFPLAPVVASRMIHRRKAILIQPREDIPIALSYASDHLECFTSGSSSGHTSLDHSSSGHFILSHSLSGHASPDTTIADSSTPLRFVYPPLSTTPRCSKAYLRWRSALLSTMYLPMTFESSAGDSSCESSAGPSRKRCRSSAATMTSSINATRALVPFRDDLLPPRKRFKDSILPEDSVEEDINANELADIKADATAIEDEVEDEIESSDRGTIEVEVDVVVEIDIPDGMLIPDDLERFEQVEEGLQDIYEHVMEIPLQRIVDIETRQRELEARSLIAGGERASLLEQVASLERSNVRL
nr:hypothetical protein [Tanacetum cinerariifolium]